MSAITKEQIPAPKFHVAEYVLTGTAPYVSNKFSAEAREMMRAKQAAGSQAKKGAKREAKDFDKCFREYDADMFTRADLTNLLARVGVRAGRGEAWQFKAGTARQGVARPGEAGKAGHGRAGVGLAKQSRRG